MQNRAADAICKSRGKTGGPAHSRPLRLCGHHHLRRHLLSSSSSCWTVSGCCGCCAVVMTTRRIACCSALAVTWLSSAIRLSLVLKYSYAVSHIIPSASCTHVQSNRSLCTFYCCHFDSGESEIFLNNCNILTRATAQIARYFPQDFWPRLYSGGVENNAWNGIKI